MYVSEDKTRPEIGETTVSYATRLREKAHECNFGDNRDQKNVLFKLSRAKL